MAEPGRSARAQGSNAQAAVANAVRPARRRMLAPFMSDEATLSTAVEGARRCGRATASLWLPQIPLGTDCFRPDKHQRTRRGRRRLQLVKDARRASCSSRCPPITHTDSCDVFDGGRRRVIELSSPAMADELGHATSDRDPVSALRTAVSSRPRAPVRDTEAVHDFWGTLYCRRPPAQGVHRASSRPPDKPVPQRWRACDRGARDRARGA